MTIRRTFFFFAILFLFCCYHAFGRRVTITYTGRVGGATDPLGIFGPSSGDLRGKGFTAVFVFDDAVGVFSPVSCTGSSCQSHTTGRYPSSPGTATLNIDGHIATFGTPLPTDPQGGATTFSIVNRIVQDFSDQNYHLFNQHVIIADFTKSITAVATIPAGQPLLTRDADWRAPLCLPVTEPTGSGEFVIRIGDLETKGTLLVETMGVERACAPAAAPVPTPCDPLIVKSQTLSAVPGVPNSRRRIGVGEQVILTASTPVDWTKSGEGYLTRLEPGASPKCYGSAPSKGTQACFTAPYVNATTVITATSNNSSCTVSFTTVLPEKLIFQRIVPRTGGNYRFFASGLDFNIGMTSAAFLVPGDVSFSNALLSELDVVPNHFIPFTNSLFSVEGVNAWLVGCDKDQDSTNRSLDVAPPKRSYWIFTDLNKAHSTPFSFVETDWSHRPLGDYQYSKRQIKGLSGSGTWVNTPGILGAVLILPPNAPNHDDWMFPRTPSECEVQVKRQFQPLQ